MTSMMIIITRLVMADTTCNILMMLVVCVHDDDCLDHEGRPHHDHYQEHEDHHDDERHQAYDEDEDHAYDREYDGHDFLDHTDDTHFHHDDIAEHGPD